MTRKDQVMNSFHDNFEKYKNENIVIFGTGEYAEGILTCFKEYNIVGVLDRWLSQGEWFGKLILSYSDVLEKSVNVIIIAASQYNTETIWRRICKFCIDNEIQVFSLEGELLNNRVERHVCIGNKSDELGRYYECKKEVVTKQDAIYWKLINERFFTGKYVVDVKGRLHVQSAYDIGYLFLGPIMTDFLLWIIDIASNNQCSNILFVARDGFLLHKMYQYLQRTIKYLPNAQYLLTSRYVCMLSNLYEVNDIIDCIRINFEGDASSMLQKRFLLEKSEILEWNSIDYENSVEYILAHKDKILSKAEKIRAQYIKYLEQNGVKANEKTLFFDLVASGTCQKGVEKLMNKQFVGAYMMRMPTENDERNDMHIFSYHEFDEEFATHSMFMESILTSLSPTLLLIDESQNPMFVSETRKDEELVFIKDAQNGVFDYFKAFFDTIGEQIPQYEKSNIPTIIYNHVVSYYTIIENNVFNNYVINDEIFNQKNSVLNKCIV